MPLGNFTTSRYGLWTTKSTENLASYIGQVWKALSYHKSMLLGPCILIGDFNSNQIWDKQSRVGNHTDVVNKLAEYGIMSLYHDRLQEAHGERNTAYVLPPQK